MKRTFLILPLLVAVVALLAAAPAFAQGRGQGHTKGQGMGMLRGGGAELGLGRQLAGRFWSNPAVQSELGLTADQVSTLETLQTKLQEDMIDLGADIKKAHLAVEQTMRAERFNLSAAKQAADDLSQAQLRLTYRRLEHHAAVKGVLTADQVAKLQTLVPEKMRERREERRQRRTQRQLTP